MILPGRYANGFAPRDGQPLYPELWKGCVGAWNPGLGVTGLTLRDQSGFGRHGTLTNGPTWGVSGKDQVITCVAALSSTIATCVRFLVLFGIAIYDGAISQYRLPSFQKAMSQ